MTKQELARKLLEFYRGDPARWTKQALARRADGAKTTARDMDAVCWCAVGACTYLQLNGRAVADAWFDLVQRNDACRDFEEFQNKLLEVAGER